jgi:hypothetical protein
MSKIKRLSQSGMDTDKDFLTVGGKKKSKDPQLVKSVPDATGQVKILDRNSKADEIPVDVRMHGASIEERDKQIRGRKQEPNAPEIQLRPTAPASWKDVKDGKDDLG